MPYGIKMIQFVLDEGADFKTQEQHFDTQPTKDPLRLPSPFYCLVSMSMPKLITKAGARNAQYFKPQFQAEG